VQPTLRETTTRKARIRVIALRFVLERRTGGSTSSTPSLASMRDRGRRKEKEREN